MRAQMIVILSFSVLALSACGQINNSARPVSVNGVNSSSDSSNYIPSVSASPAPNGTSTSPVSGATSSSPPTLSNVAENGSSNTLGIGSNISLEAPFQADSTLTYQWYKNGSKISGATSSELSLSSIGASDYGYYNVRAVNSMGSLTSAPFYINPLVMLATLGSHDCNGSQCWNDSTTADKVCKIRFGSQSVIYNQYAYGSSNIKWTTQYCSWNGSTWSCQSNCTSGCSAYNVLGYVYCLQ